MNDELRDMALKQASASQLEQVAPQHGLVLMREEGWRLAHLGFTTPARSRASRRYRLRCPALLSANALGWVAISTRVSPLRRRAERALLLVVLRPLGELCRQVRVAGLPGEVGGPL